MNEKKCSYNSNSQNCNIKNHEEKCCHEKHSGSRDHVHEQGCEHGHKHDHCHDGACYCHEHDHGGCGCDREHGTLGIREILWYVAGALALIPAFLSELGLLYPWIGIVLSVLVYLFFGKEVFLGAVRDIRRGRLFTEFTLMGMATIGAIVLLEFADAAAVMFLYSIGEAISGEAYRRSRKNISALIELDEAYVAVEKNGSIQKKKASEVSIGDIMSVRVGEKISLDGIVTDGVGFADTSAVTGESVPVELSVGAFCLSGSILISGSISVEATAAYEDSTVNRLKAAVKEAAERKAKTEKRMTRFAEIFTPIAFGVALTVFAAGIFAYGSVARAAKTALVILVASCPCSLVLSVPLTYFAGIGRAAGHGIVFRGGEAIDRAVDVRAIVFDKTGTLTSAHLDFEGLRMPSDGPFSQSELLDICASALAKSPHAAAEAFCRAHAPRRAHRVENAENIGGRGLVCLVDGREAAFGNAALMNEKNIAVPSAKNTCIYISINGKFCGILEFGAAIKNETSSELAKLRCEGIERLAIVSGDHMASVAEAAEKLGVDEFYAECKPDEKLELLERIDREVKKKDSRAAVAFCGDGLNDSAAITRADVGIAMGSGSALTVESADVVIVDDNIARVGEMLEVARSTHRIATQNIWLSLCVKLAVILVGLWAPLLELAVVADVGAAVLTVLNAMRAGKNS